jgi:rsbT co-antagonist protein RsbR
MNFTNAKDRIDRMQSVLARVAEGAFDQNLALGHHEDELSGLEMGINFMVMDLRAMVESNREKEARLVAQQEELAAKLKTIEEQSAAIRELSTPVMEVWDDILVLPIVGTVDTSRSMDIMNALLGHLVAGHAKCVIIDITGVEVVDTKTADYLLKVARAARLLGTRCVLTGLRPAVAQTLVEIGADISELATLRNLKEGLKDCLAYLHRTAKAQGAGV